jgi:opacity protein-like surface antigen
MRSVKFLIAAGAATLLSTTASAADMPIAVPPMYGPPPAAEFSGWYLRGDIGMTNQRLKSLDNVDSVAAGSRFVGLGFDSSPLFDLGAGYQFNNWFRADVIGQYRGRANFHAAENFNAFGLVGIDNYTASKSEWVVMANAYVDLGTWWCVTPFVGAGVGASFNQISGFRDDGQHYNLANPGFPQFSSVYAGDTGTWNFAWALHAGLAYKVTPGFTVELAYSYMNLGSATTGVNAAFDGSPVPQHTWTMRDITSNDVKLGVRWNLDNPLVYAPPLVTKG